MTAMIYFVIVILFLVHIFWTWNNTKCFGSNFTRVLYIIIGTLFVALITYIVYLISRANIKYTNSIIISKVRDMIMLIFVPINGFLILPQIANLMRKRKNDDITNEQLKKKIVFYIIFIVVIFIFECSYFKGIQGRIMQFINLR